MDINQQDFENAIERLRSEYSKLRTGRANPAILDGVKVDFYGQTMQIQQLGTVSVPEARQLLVQPWDKNALQPLEDAIRNSDLGLNPTNEGDKLRITLPELTAERREELVKLAAKMAEEARVAVRNAREIISKGIKKSESTGDTTEDDKFREEAELQKIVDDHNQQIKEIQEKKEQEIRTV